MLFKIYYGVMVPIHNVYHGLLIKPIYGLLSIVTKS